MIIDWVFIVLLGFSLYRGYRRGAILAIFSILAFLVGIAAALKLSTTLISLFSESYPELAKWLPFIVYLLVFLVVVWLVRLLAKALQKVLETIALGWLNRFLGALFYAALFSLVFSVFLWLFTQMNLISYETISASKSYAILEPLAPRVFSLIGTAIPVLKDGFEELSRFFEQINRQINTHAAFLG